MTILHYTAPMKESILKYLNTDYALAVETLTPLTLGADLQAALFKADAQDKSYFVKLKQGSAQTLGVQIVEMLAEVGIKHVIAPIRTPKGQTTLSFDNHTLIVYPFIEGNDGFSEPLSDEQWVSLGKVLRQVHAMTIAKSLKEQLRQENFSGQWRESVTSLLSQLDILTGSDAASLTMLNFLKRNQETILRIVDKAKLLAQKLQTQSHPLVLCHSDIHGGNVLLDDEGSFYIVDWDEPMMAPKERDLMFIGAGVANVWNEPYEQALFYKGYGETDINTDLITYYRNERIVVDIVEFSNALLFSTEGEDRALLLEHFLAMFELNGVVDIALQSSALLK